MASLTSTSTDEQVWAAFDDNASFEEDRSVGKARSFVTACMILLRRRPKQYTSDGQTAIFDEQSIREELARARRYVAANQSAANGGGNRAFDLSGSRC